MAGVIVDTSVYINSLRQDDFSLLANRRIDLGGKSYAVFLSCVVLAELFSGADDIGQEAFEKFEYDFSKINRLLAPTAGDWSMAGKILYDIGLKHGFEAIGRSRMINDCLIAMTARRLGLIVITHNTRHFRMISEIRSFKFEEIVKA